VGHPSRRLRSIIIVVWIIWTVLLHVPIEINTVPESQRIDIAERIIAHMGIAVPVQKCSLIGKGLPQLAEPMTIRNISPPFGKLG
jgi:hypothetical protein